MSNSQEATYCLGRPLGRLDQPYRDEDKSYGSTRLDKKEINNFDFKHCTFINISFKEGIINDGEFLNCIFLECYFRRAELQNIRFIGCRFIDCNFSHVMIKSCDFRHSSFRRCQINYSELSNCFPSEPNLREEITRNLAIESRSLGLSSESKKYRLAQIQAKEKNLLSAFKGESQWYRDHFDFWGRIKSFSEFILSKLNKFLWGYGEKSLVLVRNLLLTTFIIFPILFALVQNQLESKIQNNIGFKNIILFSIENILPTGIISGVVATGNFARLLAGLESFFGLVLVTLFASYIFRWILH